MLIKLFSDITLNNSATNNNLLIEYFYLNENYHAFKTILCQTHVKRIVYNYVKKDKHVNFRIIFLKDEISF